jgi:hypothetical protein
MDPDHRRTLPFFSSLSDKTLDTVSACASETSVSAGELIVREGEYRYTLIVIETGTADVIKAGEIIASLGPGRRLRRDGDSVRPRAHGRRGRDLLYAPDHA